jgi:hypothetical protein
MEDYFKTKPDLKKAFQIARQAASETKEPIEKEAEPKIPTPVGPDSVDSTPPKSGHFPLAASEVAELLSLIKALSRYKPQDNPETVQALCVVLSDLAEQLERNVRSAMVAVGSDRGSMPLEDYLDAIERREIIRALEIARHNKTEAARLLGVTFRTLRYRLEKHGLN